MSGFPKLTEAAQNGTLSQNYKEVDGKSGDSRNWDRIARNRAAIQGIPFEQAKAGVAQDYHLPDSNKSLPQATQPSSGKTSNSGDGTDTQTADDGQYQDSQQQTAGTDTDDADQALMAQATQLPPEGTAPEQYLADLTGDQTPVAFAAMNSALSETDPSAASPGLMTEPNVDDDAAVVPADMDMNTYASDLTGDDTPTQFAPMSVALYEDSGLPPDPTLLGGDTSGQAFA